jgi:hypothetical protein
MQAARVGSLARRRAGVLGRLLLLGAVTLLGAWLGHQPISRAQAPLPPCPGAGASCGTIYENTCRCTGGTFCEQVACPNVCYRVCFLWWCWIRCERPETCSIAATCQ